MMYLAADGFSGLLVSSGFCVNRTLILEVILQKHDLNFYFTGRETKWCNVNSREVFLFKNNGRNCLLNLFLLYLKDFFSEGRNCWDLVWFVLYSEYVLLLTFTPLFFFVFRYFKSDNQTV